MRTWSHRVTAAEVGQRLDRYLQQELPDLTRSRIKRLTEAGHVRVDGSPVKAGHPLRDGELIEVRVPPHPEITPEPEDLPLAVVHEDDALLVIDKRSGMAVHPGAGRTHGTLVNALLGRKTPLSPLGAPVRPGIVHRLDKDTSGLLVVAKTETAHRELSRALAAREINRRYWAMIWGTPTPETGTIDAALARSPADRRRMRVVRKGGKEAVTRYHTRWSDRTISVVALALQTGRTHQIRAHFKHTGHPVFGDPDYGGRSRRASGLPAPVRDRVRQALAALGRQALHAAALSFRHPDSGTRLGFTSPLPADIVMAAEALGVDPGALDTGPMEDV